MSNSSSYKRDKHYLERIIEPNIVSVGFLLLISLSLWFLGYVFAPQEVWNCSPSGPLDKIVTYNLDPTSMSSYALGWLCSFFVGIALFILNERNNIISKRTLLPIFFYVLLIGSNVNSQQFVSSSISNIFTIIAIDKLYSEYRRQNPVVSSFGSGAMLMIASLFCEEYIFLFPFIWIGMIRQNTMTLRMWLANILGAATVAFVLFGFMFLYNDELTMAFCNEYIECFGFAKPEFETSVIIFLFFGIQIYCTLVAIFNSFNRNHIDNIKGSKLMSVTTILLIGAAIIFFVFSNKMPLFYPLVALFESIVLSHYFTLNNRRFSQITFSVMMSCFALYFLNSIIFQ